MAWRSRATNRLAARPATAAHLTAAGADPDAGDDPDDGPGHNPDDARAHDPGDAGRGSADDLADDGAFAEFVRASSASLHRTAYLITGNRDAAQDAVQTALTRVYLAWSRHADWDNPTAYARQVVVNVVLTSQRRKWTGELPQAELSDRVFGASADRTAEVAERDALKRALDALPVRQRTAVVLRHYLDLSEAQTAAEMGTPVGTIKSLTARGLEALRGQLKEVAS